jgi:hypothetical protein
MKSWKFKILFPVIILTVLVGAKYTLWDYPVSTGKRVGNLTKISKKGKIFQTWEGTIDEGSGDKLTSYFSVRDNLLAEELYNYEGKQVILYYEEHFMGWPRDTKYTITSWKPKDSNILSVTSEGTNPLVQALSKTLFCTLLGSLYKDQELYQRVKDFVKENNLYLYKQYSNCNE